MTVREARQTMARAFQDDPDFRYSYQANIACLLRDRGDVLAFEASNEAADAILRLIFGDVAA